MYIVGNSTFAAINLVKDWNEVASEFFLHDVTGDDMCTNVENAGIISPYHFIFKNKMSCFQLSESVLCQHQSREI